jgi:hypothetical protein
MISMGFVLGTVNVSTTRASALEGRLSSRPVVVASDSAAGKPPLRACVFNGSPQRAGPPRQSDARSVTFRLKLDVRSQSIVHLRHGDGGFAANQKLEPHRFGKRRQTQTKVPVNEFPLRPDGRPMKPISRFSAFRTQSQRAASRSEPALQAWFLARDFQHTR